MPEKSNTPRERPILLSGPMARSILEGRKTITRRRTKKKTPATVWKDVA